MKIIIDIPDNVFKGAKLLGNSTEGAVIQLPLEVITKALPFEEFANKLTNDIYKFQRDSLDNELAECYHIALLSVMSNCQEVEHDD